MLAVSTSCGSVSCKSNGIQRVQEGHDKAVLMPLRSTASPTSFTAAAPSKGSFTAAPPQLLLLKPFHRPAALPSQCRRHRTARGCPGTPAGGRPEQKGGAVAKVS